MSAISTGFNNLGSPIDHVVEVDLLLRVQILLVAFIDDFKDFKDLQVTKAKLLISHLHNSPV
ncbi:hypothetical protein D3C73_1674300 [compost metagenome]